MDRAENLCLKPVAVAPDLVIPRCMHLITADDVIRAVELYHDGGALEYLQLSRSINGTVANRLNDVLSLRESARIRTQHN